MNKKQLILENAKRLFGRYGYLGFTLKQLAQACDMTSPALYYFYFSKAELFKDCLLSELFIRNEVIEHSISSANTVSEFIDNLVVEAIEVCDIHTFVAGQAMIEIIHLPEEMQQELRTAWHKLLIEPVEVFLGRILPSPIQGISTYLLATYLINVATFSASHAKEFSQQDLLQVFSIMATTFDSEGTKS